MDVDISSQRLQASVILSNVYAKSVNMEGELSSAEMQAAVGDKQLWKATIRF